MTRAGLIGPPEREELVRLAIRLEERGGEAVMVDSTVDPALRIEGDRVHAAGVPLERLQAIYVSDLGIRSPWVRLEGDLFDGEASEKALVSSRRHLAAWNAALEALAARGVRVVNPPATHDLHALKAWEVHVYARRGVPVPRTLATSDPAEIVALAAEADRRWVRKGMVGGYGYTEAFDPPATIAGARRVLEGGPVMIQERIEGDNVRAFVLNGRVIGAAEISSAGSADTDSRRGESRLRRINLPEEAADSAVAAAGIWAMPFCAVDFMREAASGRFLVLECNSAPFFVNFERRSGCDIGGPLADHLLGRGRAGGGPGSGLVSISS